MPAERSGSSQLRLRVFAGPNGSGKSTITEAVQRAESGGYPIDIGTYINADDIARALANNQFNFQIYNLNPNKNELFQFAQSSGLLRNASLQDFEKAMEFKGLNITLLETEKLDWVAQIIARFLREALLIARRRFSFETVFSHDSNLDIMKRAAEAGYKVYLYFVSTESHLINQYRVELRTAKGGHDVPPDRIKSRYYQSLKLLYPATEISYQAYFFDNSDETFQLVAHFKRTEAGLQWETPPVEGMVAWFDKYYLALAERAE
jgi:predicted ABC-type ATPase